MTIVVPEAHSRALSSASHCGTEGRVTVKKMQSHGSETAASLDRAGANGLLDFGAHPHIGKPGREETRDASGRILSVTSWDGTGTVWKHDGEGRLISTTRL